MKVKLITTYAGPKGTFMAGSTIDVLETEAKDLVAGGYAELVEVVVPESSAEVETATVEVSERAVTRGKVKTRRRG